MAGNPAHTHVMPCGKYFFGTGDQVQEKIKVHQRVCASCKDLTKRGTFTYEVQLSSNDFDGINRRAIRRIVKE